MRDRIDKIRELLSELETESQPDATLETMRVFSGLELPDIVRDIVDLLMPSLKPYEAAFYWHLFRHSVVETGTPLLRIGFRGLQTGVIRSAYADGRSGGKELGSTKMSEKTSRDTLRGLEELGAIRKEGDANRDGTLYRFSYQKRFQLVRRRVPNGTKWWHHTPLKK